MLLPLLLVALEPPSKMLRLCSDGVDSGIGTSKPARFITDWAMDFSEDMPSGSFAMRPLAVEGAGEQELAGSGDERLLAVDWGEADGGIGVVLSASLV